MSYEADTIQRCVKRITADLEKQIERWSEVVFQEGRDGRELLFATRDLFVQTVKAVGGTRDNAHALVDGYDKHISGEGESKIMRQASLLIAPNGRPFTKVT